jgi:hypothetical protein
MGACPDIQEISTTDAQEVEMGGLWFEASPGKVKRRPI